MQTTLEIFREIEATADRALRDDEYRRGDYLDEIKHLAFMAQREERRECDETLPSGLKEVA